MSQFLCQIASMMLIEWSYVNNEVMYVAWQLFYQLKSLGHRMGEITFILKLLYYLWFLLFSISKYGFRNLIFWISFNLFFGNVLISINVGLTRCYKYTLMIISKYHLVFPQLEEVSDVVNWKRFPLLYIQNAINKNTVEWVSWVYLTILLIFGKQGFHFPSSYVVCVLVKSINNFTFIVDDFLRNICFSRFSSMAT